MIPVRLVKYAFFALVASALLVDAPLALKGGALSPIEFIVGAIFGIGLHSIVIVRLPLFRNLYRDDPFGEDKQFRTLPNRKAAPVMSGLLTGGVAYLAWLLLGVGDGPIFAISAAVGAGTMAGFYALAG